ncbi:hypothetical protein [aff. Roholtiella sp. LEGE 12411]|uniref:hypothetical protein n=1 Tax=aff. Roholtiella sp. LEGE 12411 TaxID=1828822 RepID=UPI00187E4DCC|nr:hypothetical protein [aff. Roholtiella sp. LEGE 12411]
MVIRHWSLGIGHWASRAIAESSKIKTFTKKANSTLRGKDMQYKGFGNTPSQLCRRRINQY